MKDIIQGMMVTGASPDEVHAAIVSASAIPDPEPMLSKVQRSSIKRARGSRAVGVLNTAEQHTTKKQRLDDRAYKLYHPIHSVSHAKRPRRRETTDNPHAKRPRISETTGGVPGETTGGVPGDGQCPGDPEPVPLADVPTPCRHIDTMSDDVPIGKHDTVIIKKKLTILSDMATLEHPLHVTRCYFIKSGSRFMGYTAYEHN